MPHLSLLFARRYLFSKKSHSVINVISGVSAVAVAVPVMAMVILLSVFNGFEGLIRDMYKSFDPDILITPSSGKVFDTEKTIVSYDNLGIARLIYQLPTTLCDMFLREVFKRGSIESLDHETLFTIQRFFENNLNVSETSRKLFVHRNTLVYRLEKIKKLTGLDLREFDDAIIFKVALMVKKYLVSRENRLI